MQPDSQLENKLAAILTNETISQRRQLTLRIAESQSEAELIRTIPLLDQWVTHPEIQVRRRVFTLATTLAEKFTNPTSLLPLAETISKDPCWTVRESAVEMLISFAADSSLKEVERENVAHLLLRFGIRDRARLVRSRAGYGVALACKKQDADSASIQNWLCLQVQNLLKDDSFRTKKRTIELIGHIPDIQSIVEPMIVPLLDEAHVKIRVAALEYFKTIVGSGNYLESIIVPTVKRCFDAEQNVSKLAIETLKFYSDDSTEVLNTFLDHVTSFESQPKDSALLNCLESMASIASTDQREQFTTVLKRRLMWATKTFINISNRDQPQPSIDNFELAAVIKFICGQHTKRSRREIAWLSAQLVGICQS